MLKLMYHLLIKANERYFIMHDHPRSAIDWILTAYGTKIAVIRNKSKRTAEKILILIALIDHIENLQKMEVVPYI